MICVALAESSVLRREEMVSSAYGGQEPIHGGEKRWPANSVFIDDDKPCRCGCHSNHPLFASSPLRDDSGDIMVELIIECCECNDVNL